MKKMLSLLFLCLSSTLTVISQDAITWNGWTHDFGNYGTVPVWLAGAEGAGGVLRPYTSAQIRTFLGQPSGGETWQSVIDRNSLINGDNRFLLLNRSAVNKYLGVQWQTNGDNDFFIGQRETGDRDFHIYNYGIGATNFILKRNDGNVGIGTTSPDQKLTIKGGGIGFDHNSADKKLYSPVDGVLEWMTHNGAGEHGFAVSHQGSKSVFLNSNGDSYLNSGNVGIGTTTPSQKLEVNGNITLSSEYQKILLPMSLNYTGGITGDDGQFKKLTLFHGNSIVFETGTNEPSYNNTRMTIDYLGNVGIGTTSPTEKLSVNGNIRSKKIIVSASPWPDYVFDSSYQLASLHYVEKYIQQNKHLPEVPSATEVKKEGVDLGDNQAVLLKKIEELTLYIIEQNKKTDALEQRILKIEAEKK
jgi:hypothetical protein